MYILLNISNVNLFIENILNIIELDLTLSTLFLYSYVFILREQF